MRRPLLLALMVLVVFGASSAMACMAVNAPGIRIIRAKTAAGERVQATAFVSEYDCFAMTAKTYCAIGVRLSPGPKQRKAAIEITGMRFVLQDSGKPLGGFEPRANNNTARSFEKQKAGRWYGFSALFGQKTELRGGVEMRIEFTAAPGTTDSDLREIFSRAHVGASGATADGTVTTSHHYEVLPIGSVRVVGESEKHAAK